MIIGLVGLPSSGKSTFFKAATLAEVDIANYPFTTIEKNEGVAYIKTNCVEKEFNLKCNPKFGYCINGKRFIPIRLIDVAGLVEGSHLGKGRGNQFLNDLSEADVLIHIVDVSGSTNENGEPVEPLSHDPLKNIGVLENEIDLWFFSVVKKGFEKFSKKAKYEKTEIKKELIKQLSGLKVTEESIEECFRKFELKDLDDNSLLKFSKIIRRKTKPILLVANKIDIEGAENNFKKLKEKYDDYVVIPCSAESELALREAAKHNLINYIPGENHFKIISDKLNEKQKNALNFVQEKILKKYNGTGVQDVLDKIVFDFLKLNVIYPVENDKLTDKSNKVLPDAFLMETGKTALDLAFKVHQDIGKKFNSAIDEKTKKRVGKDYILKNSDVIKIITN